MSTLADWWQRTRDEGAAPPYMLIDCAGFAHGMGDMPRQIFSELECLFTGDLADELADVGGYLGRLRSWDDEVEEVVADLLQRQLGLLLLTPTPDPDVGPDTGTAAGDPGFSALHRHLRKFNVVYGPDGKPLFWRYYDPRTLPDVLNVLDGQQLKSFFGPVARFVHAANDGSVTELEVRQDQLAVTH